MRSLIIYQLHSKDQSVKRTIESLTNLDEDIDFALVQLKEDEELRRYCSMLEEQYPFVSSHKFESRPPFERFLSLFHQSNADLVVFLSSGFIFDETGLKNLSCAVAQNKEGGVFLPYYRNSSGDSTVSQFSQFELGEMIDPGPIRAYSASAIRQIDYHDLPCNRAVEHCLRLQLCNKMKVLKPSGEVGEFLPSLEDSSVLSLAIAWDPITFIHDEGTDQTVASLDASSIAEYDSLFVQALQQRGVYLHPPDRTHTRHTWCSENKLPVSVLIPTQNRASFLVGAVRSVLQSTFKKLELIVIDNGSTDGTRDALSIVKDPRLRVIDSTGFSLTESLNAGIQAAKGHVITRVDSDDLLAPDALEKHILFLKNSQQYQGAMSPPFHIDMEGQLLSNSIQSMPSIESNQMLRFQNIGSPRSYLRSALLEIGGYDETHFDGYAEDYDLALRFAERFRIGIVPEQLYYYRHHPKSQTGLTSAEDKIAARHLALKNAFQRRCAINSNY